MKDSDTKSQTDSRDPIVEETTAVSSSVTESQRTGFPISKLDFESLAKTVAFVAIIAYAIGLIVVNIHLFYLGVADFDLLKPRFILTGAFPLALVVAAAGTANYFRWAWGYARGARESSFSNRASHVLASAMYIATLMWTLIVVFHQNTAQAIVTYAVAAIFGATLVRVVKLTASFNWYFMVQAVTIALGAAIYLLELYSLNVYPLIPQQFGGSQPRQGQFLIKPDSKSGMVELGLTFGKGDLTTPVSILFEGNTYYVVQGPPPSILNLDKTNVVAVKLPQD